MASKVSSYNVATAALTGTGTINIIVPGTFSGIDPTQPSFSGRNLIRLGTWLEARAPGDGITTLAIVDIDNVLGHGANFVVQNIIDSTVSAGNQLLSLPPEIPFQIDFPKNTPKKTMIPSGLYLQLVFQKAIVGVDTAVVNMEWDDLT